MRRLCLRCWERHGRKVPVTIAGDGRCDDCRDSASERASEQQAATYYSGGGLWAERERAVKR
jgi:hypothetical protein